MACGDDAFADAVLAAAREVPRPTGARRAEHVIKPHATDAGWLAEAGTDCLSAGA